VQSFLPLVLQEYVSLVKDLGRAPSIDALLREIETHYSEVPGAGGLLAELRAPKVRE